MKVSALSALSLEIWVGGWLGPRASQEAGEKRKVLAPWQYKLD